MLVELDGLGFPDVWVELIRAVITRTQRDAVIGHVIQETRLCGTTFSIRTSKCGTIGATFWETLELTRETLEVFEGNQVGADVLLPVDGL